VLQMAISGEFMADVVRVEQPGVIVSLPGPEKIRYTPKKMGYHGGGTLQEMIIPIGVYRNVGETDAVEGWREVPRQEPSWWHLDEALNGTAEAAPKPPVKTTKKSKQDRHTLDLFDKTTEKEDQTIAEEHWIAALFVSPVYAQMKSRVGRVIIGEDQLQRLLMLLAERGGQQMVGALVQSLGIPSIRMNGFLAGAQKLLNVDGYPVLSIDRATKTVKLNVESLKTQFEL